MSKLVFIDITEVIFVEDQTVYTKELPLSLNSKARQYVKIPDDEIVRKLRVMFKNGETVYIEGNDEVTTMIEKLKRAYE